MKRTVKILLMLFFVALLNACTKKGVDIQGVRQSDDFNVQLLFEYKGATMYRFEDAGRLHYFLLGNGKVANTEQSSSNGKTTSYWDDAPEVPR
jgi:hypothetical protein